VVPLALLIEAIATDAYPSVINQSLGNVLLLMPVGLYLPFLAPRASHLGTLMLVGLCASLLIEFSQLAISAVLGYTYKIADIDDVILNTVGVAVGYAAFRVIRWRFPNL
jgi:glycopeptide antibiotics resistance protein